MDEDLILMQDDAYKNLLEHLATEEDPEKLQQLANAVAQIEKGRNDAMKISNENDINMLKFEYEKKNRKEDEIIAEKQRKSDKRWRWYDGVLALVTLGAGIWLGVKTKKEEEESYVKNPKTDMKAERFLDRVTKRR